MLAGVWLLFASLTSIAVIGWGPPAFRSILRSTAATSTVLFLSTFTASSWQKVRPGRWSRWALRNRRYLGLSFATSHLMHLTALLSLVATDNKYHSSVTTLVFGSIGFLVIAAMAATSFDRTAAWLGRKRWELLHKNGAYYIWFVFFATYEPKVGQSLAATLFTAALLAALGLRIYVARMRPTTSPGVSST